MLYLALTFLVFTTTCSYVDYTYAKYLQEFNPKKYSIHVGAKELDLDTVFKFPQACNIWNSFSYSSFIYSTRPSPQEFAALQSQVTRLLRMSEQIKALQILLKGQKTTAVRPFPAQNQLEQLRLLQKQLNERKDIIQKKTAQLNDILISYRRGSYGKHFKQMQLKYEKSALESSLRHFQKLKTGTNEEQFNIIQKIFQTLDSTLTKQTTFIQNLLSVWKKGNSDSNIDKRIAALEAKINILKITVEDKAECYKDKMNLIENTAIAIQMKKYLLQIKEFENKDKPNEFCDGLANKIRRRVLTVLAGYNYTFTCAEKYPQLLLELTTTQTLLSSLKAKVPKEDSTLLQQEIERQFKTYQQKIEETKVQISKYHPRSYIHNTKTINDIVMEIKKRLAEIEGELKSLTKGESIKIDENVIKNLVNEIKKLVQEHCHRREKYQASTRMIQKEYVVYQQEVESVLAQQNRVKQSMQNLVQLQREFKIIKEGILKKLY